MVQRAWHAFHPWLRRPHRRAGPYTPGINRPPPSPPQADFTINLTALRLHLEWTKLVSWHADFHGAYPEKSDFLP